MKKAVLPSNHGRPCSDHAHSNRPRQTEGMKAERDIHRIEELIRKHPVIVARAPWLPKRKNLIAIYPFDEEILRARAGKKLRSLIIDVKEQQHLDALLQIVLSVKRALANADPSTTKSAKL